VTVSEDALETSVSRRTNLSALIVAVVASLVLGAVAGAVLIRPDREPADASAEAGFARDMSVHHAQAVELAFAVYGATDDPEIRQLAYDIINTQRAQIGMFSGWLQQWDLPQTTVLPPMSWAEHGHDQPITSYDQMPGMATDEQMQKTRSAEGVAADRLFLTMMIDHHLGGVEMAEAVVPLTERSEVQRLAQTIVDGQRAEVSNMEVMLADRESVQY
jgi:uncharacterized protein (DUF305 family)